MCLTGCARHGLVPRLVAAGERRAAEEAVRDLVRDFGPGNVQVEIQRPRSRGDRRLARELAELAEAAGVPCVATGDPHAHAPQSAPAAGRLRGDRPSPDPRRLRGRAPRQPPRGAARRRTRWPRCSRTTPGPSPRRRASPSAWSSTSPATWATASPTSWARIRGETAQAALARVCAHQLGARYPNARKRAAARARLDEELALIAHHDLAGFFLLHRDILELAREVALQVRPAGSARRWLPPGRGRGSSVGSIVCYLTGLSHIDPVENGLFLGRFLNRDMASVPDIDLDFPRDVRERLIEEIITRYGPEHAALVAAFPTFRIRMAIRQLGGALALPGGRSRAPRAPGRRLVLGRRRGGGAGAPAGRAGQAGLAPLARPGVPGTARRRASPDTCHSTPAEWS